jgi:hypothetical protein
MSDEKTVSEILEEIEREICDKYCKYPDICAGERKDPDGAEELLYDRYCESCPFNRI